MESDFKNKKQLIEHLEHNSGVLKDARIKHAFEHVDRADFVFGDYKHEAYEDYALPLAEGSTISQPTTVAFMLELLDVHPGEKILEVGFGSGFVLALLADMTGTEGSVYGTERNTDLLLIAGQNLRAYPELAQHIHILPATNELGLQEKAPYDKILVSADATDIPQDLVNQLQEGGIIVIPVKGDVKQIQKKGDSYEILKSFPGFSFVPIT